MFVPGVGQGHAVDDQGELVTLEPGDRGDRRHVTDGRSWWSLPPLVEGPGHDEEQPA